jgi:hypothetical protein
MRWRAIARWWWGGHQEGQVHCSVGSNNRKGGDLAATG